MKKYIGAFILCLLCAVSAHGQKYAISTNMAGYLNFVTINAEGSLAVSQHWSVNVGAKYNPFSFGSGEQKMRNKQQAYYAGVRYWPWHTYSGWWVAGKAQYQEYNSGGVVSSKTEEGDRWGFGLTGGYTYMISSQLNVEFGLGFWGGVKKFTEYDCPKCGITTDSGVRGFISLSDVIIAINYVF